MKIGLYNLEPKIVNSAMMQVSQYHKKMGDEVEKYNLLFHKDYDKIYAFSIFDFTDKGYVTKNMICGGTGFDITTKLPKEIEECNYDWSLYPDCDYSILWFSRGCIRNCSFCVVNKKEGYIRPVEPKNLNPKGKYINIQDNNFFVNPEWKEGIKKLRELNQPINFNSGIDVRTITEEQIKVMLSFKINGQIHLAWDNPKEDLVPKLKELIKLVKPYRLMCYVLIGYNSTEEEDNYRVETLRGLKIDPFVMPFNKKDPYQKAYARYVNRKEIFKSASWSDYSWNKKRHNND